jgi:glutathione synthase/RimK-type ligase-like ATP-grasp enzyme
VSAFWYYQGSLKLEITTKNEAEKRAIQFFDNAIENEWKSVRNFIYKYLAKHTKTLSNFFKVSEVNKFEMLTVASFCGLKIPFSSIISSKKELKKQVEKLGKVITKPVYEVIEKQEKQQSYYSDSAVLLTTEMIDNLNENFVPTLVQEYIEKLYELRITFINGEIFSTALFTQNDNQTVINQKHYNYAKKTRAVPYQLPKQIEAKIYQFFKVINTNFGCVDMIVTPKQEYVFIEINLNGQFGYYSDVANYYVEKSIANYLSNMNHENN